MDTLTTGKDLERWLIRHVHEKADSMHLKGSGRWCDRLALGYYGRLPWYRYDVDKRCKSGAWIA